MYFQNNSTGADDNVRAEDAKLILESVILESLSSDELEQICEDADFTRQLVQAEVVCEKTIVRMDKKARLQRALKTATFVIAREKKDLKFKKLLTIWRLERTLEAFLLKKYYAEALRRAKASLQRKPNAAPLSGAKGAMVNKAVEKARGQFNSLK